MTVEVVHMVRHCPRCELRFVTEAELKEHLEVDHGAAVQALERYRYPAGVHAQQPLYGDLREEQGEPRRRYLVVANQSLGGEALTRRIRECISAHPAAFYVVVPATHSADYPVPAEPSRSPAATHPSPPAAAATGAASPLAGSEEPGSGSVSGRSDEGGEAQARWRLRRTIELLHSLGVPARGEVGPADPLAAVEAVLEREPVDEVIVSTLPSALSRWLAADVPGLLARRFRLPVTTVVTDHERTADA